MEKFKKFALKNSEMKFIFGGLFNCKCDGSLGTWTGNYSSQAQADRATSFWCANGGSCNMQ